MNKPLIRKLSSSFEQVLIVSRDREKPVTVKAKI